MKSIINTNKIYKSAVLFLGLLLPTLTYGQTVQIQGDDTVCLGNITSYTLSPALSGYNTTWQVNPNPNGGGTIVWNNNNNANINWTNSGNTIINVHAVNPITHDTVNTSLEVFVAPLPAPFITTNFRLGCPPLNHNPQSQGDSITKPPVFDSLHCMLVCANSDVTYYANGSDGSYTWSATGANSLSTTTGDSTIIHWGQPGYGSITLSATNAAGCTDSVTMCVHVIEGPTASFHFVGTPQGTRDITICDSGFVVLTDESTVPPPSQIISWHWDFGDGTESNKAPGASNNPIAHQYTQPGDYTIILTVTNSCGCSDTFTASVQVTKDIAPKIACPRVVCEGAVIKYTIDKPCSPHSWQVIGGTILGATAQSAKIRWDNVNPNTGFGYVTYQSCDPCPMVVVEQVPVVIEKGNIQGSTNVCMGEQYVYRLPRWPTTKFDWVVVGNNATLQSTDQPNEIALTPTNGGIINLVCKYHNTFLECEGHATLKIHVRPKVNILGPEQLCLNTDGSFYLDSGGFGHWILTDPNHNTTSQSGSTFSYTFGQAGIYHLAVTGNSFCPPKDLLIRVEDKPDKPDYIHGSDSACVGIPFAYTAGNGIPGTTFGWAVSNGSVNAEYGNQSYITFYGVHPPDTIKVWRMTTDSLHCTSDTLYKTVYDPVPPLQIAGDDTVCSSTYHNYSLNYQGGDLYRWKIIPNRLGSVVQNNHSYNPKILWNISNGQGEVAALVCKMRKCLRYYYDTLYVFVRGIPNISISANKDTVCSGTPITFTVNSSYPINSVDQVTWHWGNGVQQFGSLSNTYLHTYHIQSNNQPVQYAPSITVTHPNGCSLQSTATLNPPITVLPPPAAFITPMGPLVHCDPLTLPGYTLTTPVVTGYWPSWDYDWHGLQTPPPSTSNSWSNITTDGTYYVMVSGPAPYKCSDTSNRVKVITHCPDIGSGCGPGIVPDITLANTINDCGHIHISATVTGGTQVAYHWSYPNSATVSTQTSTDLDLSILNAGTYQIDYLCGYLNFNNDTCYTLKSINIIVPYLADLRYSVHCAPNNNGYKVTLYDHSQILIPGVTRKFFQGSTSNPPLATNVQQTSVIVPGNATYTFYETIQGGSYAQCVSSVQVSLPQLPQANFTVTAPYMPGCVNDVVFTFQDNSSPSPHSQLTHYWDFDDHATNAYRGTVSRVYSTPSNQGSYFPTLTVTNQYGCSDIDSARVVVVDNDIDNGFPQLKANPFAPYCQGQIVTLKYANSPYPYPDVYTWYKGLTQLTPPVPNNTHNVMLSGGYWTLGMDNYGCRVHTPMLPITFRQVPHPFIMGRNRYCLHSTFTLHTPDIPGADYNWMVTPPSPGSSPTPVGGNSAYLSYTANQPGTYIFRVIMSYNGCESISAPDTVIVRPPLPPPSLSYSIINCQPYRLKLTASGGPGMYNWSNGMRGNTIIVNDGGPYQVVYTDTNGCQTRVSMSTPKDLSEYLWIFPTGCFCMGGGTDGTAPGGYLTGPIIPFYYWAWLKDSTAVSSGVQSMVQDYTPIPGHVYNLVLSNGVCTDTSGNMYYDTDTCQEPGDANDTIIFRRPSRQPQDHSILENINQGQPALLLAPNPAKNSTMAYYRFGDFSIGKGTLAVYDVQGRLLRKYDLSARRGQQRIALSGLSSGLYRVVLETKRRVIRRAKLSVK